MSLADFILLIIAAPFLYVIGIVVAMLLGCLAFGGVILIVEWFEKRKQK